jgi:uncharacterized protein (DUF427 family)
MATPIADAHPRDVLRFEPSPRRVRVQRGGVTVADTRDALLVWEPRRAVCVYAFPLADVAMEHLRETDGPAGAHLGGATFYDVLDAPQAAWRFADPDLHGHVCFVWEQMDRWLEEDQEVLGHARDPYWRVDLRRSDRHVRVEHEGTLLAESRRPSLLFETTLPTRYYLPPEDVRWEHLEPTGTHTVCSYKGVASYFAVKGVPDLAWTYEEPFEDAPPLRGLVCFLHEQLDVTVDGEPVASPLTQWSSGIRDAPRGGGSGRRQEPHGTDDVGDGTAA